VNFVAKLDFTIYYLLLLYALVSSISIAAQNIVISLATLLVGVRHMKEPIKVKIDKGLLKAIGIFLLSVLISGVFAYKPILAFDKLATYIYCTLPFFLAVICITKKEDLLKICIVMGISILIADCYAIWQGINGNYRANAFSTGPMMFAGYLIQMIPLLLVFGLEKIYIDKGRKIFFIGIMIISCTALIYNGTRGAWIAVCITCLLYGLLNIKKNMKILLGVLAVIVFTGILIINIPIVGNRVHSITDMNEQSHSERVLLWKSSWHMLQDHPFVGIGPGNFSEMYVPNYIRPEAKEPYLRHAHNNFVHMFAEAGVIGGGAFIYMFCYILLAMYRRFMINPRDICALSAFLVTVSLLTQGLTEFNFGNSAVIRMYWFILGLAYVSLNIDSSCKKM